MKNRAPRIVKVDQFSPQDLDPDALKTLRRLREFGYTAYLVGGGVRDLLLGRRPKDFDISTSARPEELHDLFRNCRVIGRRFRLAHMLFAGGKIIEVATFRAAPPPDGKAGSLIVDDNVWGTPESDAFRRDFTINGLFYDAAQNAVIDYVGGLEDLQAGLLRSIGKPKVRFGEDPVRILRGVKFAARLGFDIEPECLDAMKSERKRLREAAIPRLLEEVMRMLLGGGASRSVALMHELGILDLLLPEIAAFLDSVSEADRAQFYALLHALDVRHEGQKETSNGVALSALFWPLYRDLLTSLPHPATVEQLRRIAELLVVATARRLKVPKKDISSTIDLLEGEVRYDPARPTKRARIGRRPGFDDLLDFTELRFEAGQITAHRLEGWRQLKGGSTSKRHPRDRFRR